MVRHHTRGIPRIQDTHRGETQSTMEISRHRDDTTDATRFTTGDRASVSSTEQDRII